MKNHRFPWLRNRTTDNRKCEKARAQEEAMKGGSMFGFDKPIADPANYDAQGQPLKRREKDRGDTR